MPRGIQCGNSMPKSTSIVTNFTAGEISPLAVGRFDYKKYTNAAALIENFLIHQIGGGIFRPGTKYTAEVKYSSKETILYPFQFSTEQNYMLEIGDLYIRFFTQNARLESAGTPIEVVTPYLEAELESLQFAQNADIMYIVHPNHKPRKLARTSATVFTLTEVDFVRGPFMDTNITATTITPSADTGAGITLTASDAIFDADHVGSLWRIKDGVVKITAFTDTTHVTGTVQDEPDGTTGNLGTGPAATDDWAEGAFSDYRGWPAAVSFHEQRLYYANTDSEPQKFWGSVIQEFENFDEGEADDADAVSYEIATEQVNAIRWFSSGSKSAQLGTSGASFSASSGSSNSPITPSSIVVQRDTNYGAAALQPKRLGSYIYYLQRNLMTLRELGYDYYLDSQIALDKTLVSDHILRDGGGAKDMDHQQSPNNRLWITRNDGQLAVFTRNVKQEVEGWSRLISGSDSRGAGTFESVGIMPEDEGDDQIWVIVKRYINGSYVKYVEYFMPELFDKYYDAFYVDSGLSLDNPITISGATAAEPVVITAVAHGLSNGDQIKIDEVVGMTELNNQFYLIANKTDDTFELTDLDGDDIDGTEFTTYISGGEVRKMVTAISGLDHLEGETVAVVADGAVRPNKVVDSGAITLEHKAAVVHVGLPYIGNIQLLPLSEGSPTGTGQTKSRKIYLVTFMLYRSLGVQVGPSSSELDTIFFRSPSDILDRPPDLVTGNIEQTFRPGWDKELRMYIRQSQPLPLNILAIVIKSDLNEK